MRKVKPEDFPTAYGNIGVSGKITVNLHGVKERTQQKPEAVKGLRGGKNLIHRHRQPVSHHHFHEISPKHISKSRGKPPPVAEPDLRKPFKLRQKVLFP